MPSPARILAMFLFLSAFIAVVEWLAYRSLQRTWDGASWWGPVRTAWWTGSALMWVAFIASSFLWPTWRVTRPELLSTISVVFFLVTVPKLVLAVFQILEDLRLTGATALRAATGSVAPIPRATFLSYVGQGTAAIAFSGFLYGITRGKYAYRTEHHRFALPGLPESFRGLKVVQISDAHLGSFSGTPAPVLEALASINALEPDLLCFTGDLVNTHADEALPWIEAFRGVHARMGKYSILGNHDYADYGNFTDAERTSSVSLLKDIHRQMGFELLLNSHVVLQRGEDAVVLAGVENWGKGFRQSGDLELALSGSGADNRCTILLSHDPTHFEEQVMGGKAPVELTLSGHTHGMQMGLEIPWLGLKVSPSSLRYSRWGGLYQEGRQFLHVNRGFGVLGFHGRVGMPPEITVFELEPAAV
jgi:predicted MPP superfamily phosphohydrolase